VTSITGEHYEEYCAVCAFETFRPRCR